MQPGKRITDTRFCERHRGELRLSCAGCRAERDEAAAKRQSGRTKRCGAPPRTPAPGREGTA